VSTKNIIIVFGTRPEAIKLVPIINEFRSKCLDKYNIVVCNTEQQKELSNQTLSFFGLKADINLSIMSPNQTLASAQSKIMSKLSEVFAEQSLDACFVQGDTITAFCGALVAFYNKIPVFHVEAGLRSNNLLEPFPEEALRQMLTRITELHFAPTQNAKIALLAENVDKKRIFITGNTGIDALFQLSAQTIKDAANALTQKGINLNDKLVLITVHRRENHGERLGSILSAITELANTYKTHQFVLPVHSNPNVKEKIYSILSKKENVVLTSSLDYPELVVLMKNAKLVMTDSGGIQEEAPSFSVPILVMRYETERKEGITIGFAKLVGADKEIILKEAKKILDKDKSKNCIKINKNPYGDGKASEKIKVTVDRYFEGRI
jgi:UDP-N-acetylglucosamine 2-epimerase (non-hydrolysing)